MLLRARSRLRRWLYPMFRCELCVGQEYGCWCAHHGSIAPGVGPERWRVLLRWVFFRNDPWL